MRDELLTLRQVADELGCSLRTVKRRRHEGAFTVFKDGGLGRVRRSELRRYLAAGEQRGGERCAPAQGVLLRPGERLTD